MDRVRTLAKKQLWLTAVLLYEIYLQNSVTLTERYYLLILFKNSIMLGTIGTALAQPVSNYSETVPFIAANR